MDITPAIVRELLDYDPETGVFTWRHRKPGMFKAPRYARGWNSRYAGTCAGSTKTDARWGYQHVDIFLFGKPYKAHRLAWLYMTDDPMPEEIDHRDRNATNNAWINIRASSHKSNLRNKSMQSDNTSGATGVSWNKRNRKYIAYTSFDGKRQHLGYHLEKEDAIAAVKAFRLKHGFHEGHGEALAHYHM